MKETWKNASFARRSFWCICSILLLVFILPLGAACAEVDIGTLPPGWTEQPPHHESINRYFVYQERGTVLAELLVFEEPLPEPISVADYLEALKVNSMPSFLAYSPLEDEALRMHGRDAMLHRFHFSNERDMLKAEMYVFVEEDVGYIFLFDTTDAWFRRLQPKFRAFAENTLQFPAPPPAELVVEPKRPSEIVPPEEPDKPEVPGQPDPEHPLSIVLETDPEPTPEPEQPEPAADPATGLPQFLPEEPEQPEPGLPVLELTGFLRTESETLLLDLPEGITETGRDDTLVSLEGPDDAQIIIALYESPETAAEEIAEEMEGLRRHGESTLDCGGLPVTVTLYSERDRAERKDYAVVVATWENSGAVVAIRMPAANYAGAGEWVKALLCAVDLIEN